MTAEGGTMITEGGSMTSEGGILISEGGTTFYWSVTMNSEGVL